jgi:DNA-binding response OmpR family regulator
MATKLLLIEDSLSIQTIVETTFTREGFEVIVVNDALDGLHQAQTWRPDIVLADAAMPGMDGFQLCQSIRQSVGGRYVPVVLLTSGFAAYDKTRGDQAGVTAHLAKPFEPQALLDLVKQLVSVAHRPASPLSPIPAVPSSRESEMAGELLGDPWSNVASPAAPPEVSHPAEPSPRASDGAWPATSQASQDAHPHVSSETIGLNALYHTLGCHLVQMLREALDAHLTTMLAQLTPHVLDTVRDVVQAKMPDLLEALLQQEIDKLKHAAEQEQHDV